MPDARQDLKTHPRYIPGFHFLLLGILSVNFIWSVARLFKAGLTFETAWTVVMGFAFLEFFFYMRQFATRNQDRTIRLEMRVRLRDVLPAELKARIGELTTSQLIGLRFASDAELPGLVRRVLEERIGQRTSIKAMVTDWQADFQRV
ncbi:MAG TPA: DUF6526 family protein [Gemmatimonadales bacterium]|jgi:hypothetical protein|nr:DUF6526 family protein [Gemmatimonadales bacterium]